MIRVKDFHHMAIVVSDLERCKRFYGEILGLETIERPAFNFPGHWYRVGESRQLHLMVMDEKIPETMRHFAMEVENFQKTIEHLTTHGVAIVDGPGKAKFDGDRKPYDQLKGILVQFTPDFEMMPGTKPIKPVMSPGEDPFEQVEPADTSGG